MPALPTLRSSLLAVAGLLLAARAAAAHPLDEYVQATYLTLEPGRVGVEIFLTPGVEVAARVLALVDADRDGEISRVEGRAYAERVLREVRLAVDGRPLPLRIAGVEVSPAADFASGEGTIRLHLDAGAWSTGSAGGGAHRLVYRNSHEPVRSAYLVNAYLPDAPVTIERQRRDWAQHGIEIDFDVAGGGGRWGWSAGTFRGFLAQGIRHIFTGPDHVLFVVGLLLLPATLAQLLRVVSAFTVAHSLTLALATLGLLVPPAGVVEPLIALSIIAVGVHALRRREGRDPRLLFAFGFGLLHGFGFAYALRELDLSRGGLAWSLLSFNLGVELGQICIVLLCVPALALLRSRARPAVARRVLDACSVLVILAGSFWLVQRLALLP